MDLVLARLVHKGLRPLALSLTFFYGFLAVAHTQFVPEVGRAIMVALAGATALALLGLYAWLRTSDVPVSRAHRIQAVMAALVQLNSLVHLYAVAELKQTSNVALAIVGVGLLFLSTRWLVGFVLTSLACWGLVVGTAGIGGDWGHFGFMLFAATVLAAIAHSFRLRTLRELESTRALAQEMELRKRAEEERNRLERELQHAEKLKSLGLLAGGIAHDFNNVLVPVLGNIDLALSEPGLSPSARKYLEDVSDAAERATELTRQMLAYSGKGKFVVAPIDLSWAVQEMARLLEASISKKITVEYELAEDLPAVEADAAQLGQVIMNLAINASEAIGDQRGSVTLRTGTSELSAAQLADAYSKEPLPSGRYVYLEVSDTGSGMDADAQKKAFDPFFTTKSTGRGLGLAAVSGIVRGHHGAIKFDTKSEQGTTFTVFFPACGKPFARKREASPVEPSWRGSGTVLVVDDDESVRSLAKNVLQKAGIRILVAADGVEAVEVFQDHRAEVVLVVLDLTMRNRSGEETLRELRRMQPEVKVIVSSGYTAEDVSTQLAGEDAVVFLQKPYKPAQLLDAVRRLQRAPRSSVASPGNAASP